MRVVGINGSPRKYGNTFKLLKVALKVAEAEGAETELVHLIDYDIKPCIGCLCDDQKACRYPCVIEDDMKELYDLVLESNGLIIATPVYWFSPSGIVKNFIDRLTALENMVVVDGVSWVEGKVAGVITVGNDSGVVHVLATLYATLNGMGFAIPPWAMAYYSQEGNVLADGKATLDAANVGRAVALMCKHVKHLERKWYDAELKDELAALARAVEDEAREVERSELAKRKKIFEKALEKAFATDG